MRNRLGCSLAALTLMATYASGQSFPDAARLFAGQGDLLKTASTVQYTSVAEMEMNIMGNPMKIPTTTFSQFARDKFRIESSAGGVVAMITGYDGDTTWMYLPAQKQFSRQKGLADGQALLEALAGATGNAKDIAANAKVLRSEVIDIDGQPHDCWVMESKIDKLTIPAGIGGSMKDSIYTAWIDKQLSLPVRTVIAMTMEGLPGGGSTQVRTTTTLHDVKVNLDLPDSVFQFTPPSDAKESKDLMAAMTGGILRSAPGNGAAQDSRLAERNGIGPGSGAPQVGAARQGQRAQALTSTFTPQAFVPNMWPVSRVEAKFPPQAKRDKISGYVEILATIDPIGAVVEAEALDGKEMLRQAATDAAKQWRFRPVLRNGQAVYAYTTVGVMVWDPDDESTDAFLTAELDMNEGYERRIAELFEAFPRTPQQELADLEQNLGDLSGESRGSALPILAQAALRAHALEKAASYANEMLKADTKDPNYGQLLHDGLAMRGLVAIRQGNVALAGQDLLESGKTIGVFRPTLSLALANDLLQKNGRSVVLEYLEQAKTSWKTGTEQLDSWIAAMRRGETPNFGVGFAF